MNNGFLRMFCIGAVVVLVTKAEARIGLSREQCFNQYGAAVESKDANQLVFVKGGLRITVNFHEDIVQCAAYSKLDEQGADTPLNKDEVRSIIAANCGEPEWTTTAQSKGMVTWTSNDGRYSVTYVQGFVNVLVIKTAEWDRLLKNPNSAVSKSLQKDDTKAGDELSNQKGWNAIVSAWDGYMWTSSETQLAAKRIFLAGYFAGRGMLDKQRKAITSRHDFNDLNSWIDRFYQTASHRQLGVDFALSVLEMVIEGKSKTDIQYEIDYMIKLTSPAR